MLVAHGTRHVDHSLHGVYSTLDGGINERVLTTRHIGVVYAGAALIGRTQLPQVEVHIVAEVRRHWCHKTSERVKHIIQRVQRCHIVGRAQLALGRKDV